MRLIVAKKFFAALLWVAGSVVILLLLFSYLLPQDLSRNTPIYSRLVQLSFFGRVLTFQLSLLLIVIAIFALPLRRWRLAIATMCAGVVAVAPTLLALLPHDPPAAVGPTLRLMSMNLKYTHEHAELFVDQVRRFNPDVLVVQDYTPYAQTALARAFGTDYPYRFLQPNSLQGLAIYSRKPFVEARPVAVFNKTRRQLRAVIRDGQQRYVIYVEHPFSPRSSQRIINNRLATVDLTKQVAVETLPVIVAGDFNFTAETPNESAMKDVGLKDGFELAGRGRGATWPMQPRWKQWLPGVRIDHIFVSRQMTCTRFFVGAYDGSDHLPIVADVGLTR